MPGKGRFWTEAEDLYLKEHYAAGKFDELAMALGRTIPSVRARGFILGLLISEEARTKSVRAGWEKAKAHPKNIPFVCEVCGKHVLAMTKRAMKYCGRACRLRAMHKREREGAVRHRIEIKKARPRYIKNGPRQIQWSPTCKAEKLISRRLDELFGVRSWE